MPKSANKVILVGRVGQDPVVKDLPDGAIASLSLATYSGQGSYERTSWHHLRLYDFLASRARDDVQAGDQLYIEGELDYGSYERDGVEIPFVEILVKEMVILGE